jgi:uncharacterized protein
MMEQHTLQQLIAWKDGAYRKPLILMGATQAGKTTSLRQFDGEQYKNRVYLSFEDEPHLKNLFTLLLEKGLAQKISKRPFNG